MTRWEKANGKSGLLVMLQNVKNSFDAAATEVIEKHKLAVKGMTSTIEQLKKMKENK